jgi:hypothetical protein
MHPTQAVVRWSVGKVKCRLDIQLFGFEAVSNGHHFTTALFVSVYHADMSSEMDSTGAEFYAGGAPLCVTLRYIAANGYFLWKLADPDHRRQCLAIFGYKSIDSELLHRNP